ncbi:MAG: hypothetical protein KF810_22870 [Rhizobiaceae bacterium]|nr:hypothetical protein [Rhizobiaceae bacterium]
MPLQNRVDPFGEIHAVAARGLFTGNRGVIHDPATRTLTGRRWTTQAWIICACDYKGRRREVMGRNAPAGGAGWTELFFLDDVTALAAGHRPCFTCRREAAKEYAAAFGRAFGIAKPRAPDIDARLHGERRVSGRPPIALDRKALAALPDGAMVSQGQRAFAKHGEALKAWSFSGWSDAGDHRDLALEHVRLVTPPTTIEVLQQGYSPVWHESAAGRPLSP